MIRVFCTYIPDLLDQRIVRRILPKLTKEKAEKINKYYKNEDKLRSAAAELLLRYGYHLVSQSPDDTIPEIAFTAYEKPYFSGDNRLKFNLSHSGHYVACVLADCEVGIDVECFSEDIDLSIARNYFTKAENDFIFADEKSLSKEFSAIRRFFYIWTLKESYMKLDGEGMNKPLDSFSVERRGADFAVFEEKRRQPVCIRLWDQYEDISLSLCATTHSEEVRELSVEWVSFERIDDAFF